MEWRCWATLQGVVTQLSGTQTSRTFFSLAGGQYSNLMVQCKSMGIWDKWEAVLDMYRDVNQLFGDIVKVKRARVTRTYLRLDHTLPSLKGSFVQRSLLPIVVPAMDKWKSRRVRCVGSAWQSIRRKFVPSRATSNVSNSASFSSEAR